MVILVVTLPIVSFLYLNCPEGPPGRSFADPGMRLSYDAVSDASEVFSEQQNIVSIARSSWALLRELTRVGVKK